MFLPSGDVEEPVENVLGVHVVFVTVEREVFVITFGRVIACQRIDEIVATPRIDIADTRQVLTETRKDL